MKYATLCNKILYRDIDLDRSFREHFGERNQPEPQIQVQVNQPVQEHHESIECPWTIVILDDAI